MYIKGFENIKEFKLNFNISINLCIKIYLRINQERVK